MNALGIMIDNWGKKDVAELACEKIVAAEAAAVELEKAQAALAAAQAVAEKAKAAAEEAVHRLPPVEPAAGEEGTPVPSENVVVESDDARIARIVVETLTGLGIVPQAGSNQAPAAVPAPAPQEQQQVTVVKAAEELTLAAAPVVGPSNSKGGNYPAPKQSKQRR